MFNIYVSQCNNFTVVLKIMYTLHQEWAKYTHGPYVMGHIWPVDTF